MKNKSTRSVLFAIFITVFIDLVGFGIIIPLSPYLATKFGATAVDVGQLMAVYSLMQFIFSPIWGRISDRIGRRPVILISVLGAALANLAFAFAQTLWVLYAARIFAGICGANISTSMAAIADVTDKKDRSKSMGLIGAAFGLGFILGPVLGGVGGVIGAHFGANPPFGMSFGAVIASVLALANFLIAFKFLPESLTKERRAIIKPRESRLKLVKSYLKRPTVNVLMLIYFLSIFAMAHMEPMMFLYLKENFHWNLEQSSMAFAYIGVIMVFTQGYLIRKIMPKFGERKVLLTGLILAAIGLAGIGVSTTIWELFLVVTTFGIGNGLATPSISGSISILTPEDEQGAVIGANQSMGALARIVGPELAGILYLGDHSVPFFVAGAITGVACILAMFSFGKLPEHGKNEGQAQHA